MVPPFYFRWIQLTLRKISNMFQIGMPLIKWQIPRIEIDGYKFRSKNGSFNWNVDFMGAQCLGAFSIDSTAVNVCDWVGEVSPSRNTIQLSVYIRHTFWQTRDIHCWISNTISFRQTAHYSIDRTYCLHTNRGSLWSNRSNLPLRYMNIINEYQYQYEHVYFELISIIIY